MLYSFLPVLADGIARFRKMHRPIPKNASLDSENGSERCMNKTVLLFKRNTPIV